MVLQGSVLMVVLIGVITCLPLFLALRLFVRAFKRARRRHQPTGRFVAAIAFTLIAFMFNLGVLWGTGRAVAAGGAPFTQMQALATGLAWIAFWIWLFLAFSFGRKRGKR